MVVLDLCCGSGALGVALAHLLGRVELYAADVEPAAVRCARRNVATSAVRCSRGTSTSRCRRRCADASTCSSPTCPYVPTDDIALMPPEAREHEPRVTLDGGADGLDVLRRVATVAPRWLAPGGHLLVETSEAQAAAAVDAFAAAGLAARVVVDEDAGATVVVGTLPHE